MCSGRVPPQAVENFEFAFRMCHRDYTKNRRQILMYLVCAKLLRSKYPTAELLDKHNLHELVVCGSSLVGGCMLYVKVGKRWGGRGAIVGVG